MSIKITVPNNGSDYLNFGSANTPTAAQIGGYDDGSGAGHLEMYTSTGGVSTEQMRITSAGNVGVGTSSPSYKLSVAGRISYNGAIGEGADTTVSSVGTTVRLAESATWTNLAFYTGGSERARIDSSGNLLVGTTSQYGLGKVSIPVTGGSTFGICIQNTNTTSGSNIVFKNSSASNVGDITSSTTATSYNTSSDYRLKDNVTPMTGALARNALLKPVTYTWKADGSKGEGFIAHELQEVVPDAVTGEKDAVNEDGTIKAQGIDTSFLVGHLVACIQEQQAIITDLKARIETLEGAKA